MKFRYVGIKLQTLKHVLHENNAALQQHTISLPINPSTPTLKEGSDPCY